MSPEEPLAVLAALRGLGVGYHDHRGELRRFSRATQTGILRAMGVEVDDERAVRTAIEDATGLKAGRGLPAVIVSTGDVLDTELAMTGPAATAGARVTVELEGGGIESWESTPGPDHMVLRSPGPLPRGYHRLSVSFQGGSRAESLLVLAPPRCHEPADLAGGARRWGVAVQLYTIRSPRNWGIGDFADLERFVREAATAGADFVGLNPLHALFGADPASFSPYGPSSRHWLNVLYIAVDSVPEFAECVEARTRVAERSFQAELARLRATRLVDYRGVAVVKLQILHLLHAHFRREHIERGTARGREFEAFVAARGESLRRHAIFEALDESMRAELGAQGGWTSWPVPYRDPAGRAVRAFARGAAQRIEFHSWLQWLADTQLAAAARAARDAGMSVGLYGDLAVGVSPGGSEVWSNQDVYRLGAAVGAPPDALALKGQDWGIPPQDPEALVRRAYGPFIELMRDNMRHFGALRLDHVMALHRLWWVPRGLAATEGGYVHYPLRDLVGIVGLESERNHCLVIGEDLGTVPDEVRDAMQETGVYHYKVLLFEKGSDGGFLPPADWTRRALASVSTHDLPTLKSWWEGTDIALRDRLDLYPTPDVRAAVEASRADDRERLIDALAAAGVRPRWPVDHFEPAFAGAVHAFLAASRSALAVVQAEDLLGMADPVNVPGTSAEHANWQRKLDADLAAVFAGDAAQPLLEAMRRYRPR